MFPHTSHTHLTPSPGRHSSFGTLEPWSSTLLPGPWFLLPHRDHHGRLSFINLPSLQSTKLQFLNKSKKKKHLSLVFFYAFFSLSLPKCPQRMFPSLNPSSLLPSLLYNATP